MSQPGRLEMMVTSVLGTGYAPIAPATVASAVTCLIIWFVPVLLTFPWALLSLIVFLVGVALAGRAERTYGHDAGVIVIDEFVGQWITLLAVPLTVKGFVVAFFMFRLLDIWKPIGIRASQEAPGGWGVMVDDLLAGILGALILWGAQWFNQSLLG